VNDQFEPLIAPLIKEDTAILTLQNGLGNEERLAPSSQAARAGGSPSRASTAPRRASSITRRPGGSVSGIWRRAEPRAARIAELLSSAKIDCAVLDDLRGALGKAVVEYSFNGLAPCWTGRPIA